MIHVIIFVGAIVSNNGSSQITLQFSSMNDCINFATQYKVDMKKDGAPQFAGDGGVIIKTTCYKKGD